MAYKKITGPDFPKWPTVEVDAKRERVRVRGKAFDWKGKLGWRAARGLIGMVIFTPLIVFLGMTVLFGKSGEVGGQLVAMIVAAGFVFGVVIDPIIKSFYMKTITVICDQNRLRVGRKKHSRSHRGSSLSHTFVIKNDPDAEKKARTDQRLTDTQRFELMNARTVVLVVQSDVFANAVGGVPSPGVHHKVASVLEEEQAVQLMAACSYAVKVIEAIEQQQLQTVGQEFEFD